jgi:hypothetical protein
MGTIVVKPDRDVDFYVGWSSVTESPHWWGTRSEAAEYIHEDARQRGGVDDPPEKRLARADEHGTSAYDRRDGGWDDDGFIYEQRGWLPRRSLAAACALLGAGREAAVWDLLEPFEDEAEVRRG